MKKILDLTNQRAKSLEQITESLNEVIKNVGSARESHESGASVNSVVDIARQWHQIAVQDATEKGRKMGYAEACKDITVILNQVLEAVAQEHQGLQALLGEISAAAEVSNPEAKGESSDPLS